MVIMKNDKARITYLRRSGVKEKVCVRVKQEKQNACTNATEVDK